MGPFLILSPSAYLFLTVCLSILLVIQGFLSARSRLEFGSSNRLLNYSYEIALCLVAFVYVCLAGNLSNGRMGVSQVFGVSFMQALWVASAIALVLGTLLLMRSRNYRLGSELFMLVLSLPPLSLLFPWWINVLLVLAVGWFTVRVVYSLSYARFRSRSNKVQSLLAEIMRFIPDGIVYVESGGSVLYANNAARDFLQGLGRSVDLGDGEAIMESLNDLSSAGESPHSLFPEGDSKVLRDARGRLCLVEADRVNLFDRSALCLVIVDVTNELGLYEELKAANAELEQKGDLLRKALADAQASAEAEAQSALQARVHDVIGQRLSILHRYIEDGKISRDSAEALAPLMVSIVEDLESVESVDSRVRLEALRRTFQMAGVEIRVEGNLPEDEDVARLLLDILREACTNALRHANASCVKVKLGVVGRRFSFAISNDGVVLDEQSHEGGGLSGMRRALEKRGGSLEVSRRPSFTLRGSIPLSGGYLANASRIAKEHGGTMKGYGLGRYFRAKQGRD